MSTCANDSTPLSVRGSKDRFREGRLTAESPGGTILQMGKKEKKEQDLRKKAEKMKKRRKNALFLCKKTYKIAQCFSIRASVLKWVVWTSLAIGESLAYYKC